MTEPNRKHVRFKPDFGDFGYIDINEEHLEFEPSICGLIVNLSPKGGCSFVTHKTDELPTDREVRIRVGKLAPLKGKILRSEILGGDLTRIAVEFTE